jgi:hypothetical protein
MLGKFVSITISFLTKNRNEKNIQKLKNPDMREKFRKNLIIFEFKFEFQFEFHKKLKKKFTNNKNIFRIWILYVLAKMVLISTSFLREKEMRGKI